jgi:hypothetical protein
VARVTKISAIFLYSTKQSWTNFSLQDKPWAKFSILEVAACIPCIYCPVWQYNPNLQLKTQPKQLLGSLSLVIALPETVCIKSMSLLRISKMFLQKMLTLVFGDPVTLWNYCSKKFFFSLDLVLHFETNMIKYFDLFYNF